MAEDQTEPMNPVASHPVDSNRTASGRFAPGNTAALGHKGVRPKTYAHEYLAVLRDELTPDKWRKVVRAAIEQAIEGEHRARAFLASYAMGQPVQQVIADASGSREALEGLISSLRDTLPEAGADEAVAS